MPAPRTGKSAAHWEALASQWVKHLGGFKTARTARDAIEQGNHLLLLKEASPHGTWRDEMNKRALDARTASRLMRIARQFRDAPDAFFEAVGSVSKLFELVPLGDDACELAEGKEVCGLTLERVAQMTVKELRAAVCTALASADEPVLYDRHETSRKLVRATAPPLRTVPKVRLTVEEERMLRRYRKCNAEGRAALLQVAGLLEQTPVP